MKDPDEVQMLADIRQALTADQGGEDALTEARRLIVDDVLALQLVKRRAVRWIDREGFARITPGGYVKINAAVEFLMRAVRVEADLLSKLGLERRPKEVLSPDEQLREACALARAEAAEQEAARRAQGAQDERDAPTEGEGQGNDDCATQRELDTSLRKRTRREMDEWHWRERG